MRSKIIALILAVAGFLLGCDRRDVPATQAVQSVTQFKIGDTYESVTNIYLAKAGLIVKERLGAEICLPKGTRFVVSGILETKNAEVGHYASPRAILNLSNSTQTVDLSLVSKSQWNSNLNMLIPQPDPLVLRKVASAGPQ